MILCYDLKSMINNFLHQRAKKKNKGVKIGNVCTSEQFLTCYTIIITAGMMIAGQPDSPPAFSPGSPSSPQEMRLPPANKDSLPLPCYPEGQKGEVGLLPPEVLIFYLGCVWNREQVHRTHHTPFLPLSRCGTLGKSLCLPMPQLSHQ